MVKSTLMILLLLLPLCLGIQQYKIKCYGEDFYMLRNQELDCTAKVPQACYTRDNGEKGCAREHLCSRPGWTCCHQDLCNATPPPA